MQSRVRLLNLVVSFTLILLAIGATLVVLGMFNESLHWDIFGPRLEAFLYGVFGSCMALACFGVAMTGIIAVQESVKDFKRFVLARTNQVDAPDAPRRAYAARILMVVAGMAALVILCALIDHVVLVQRCNVFRRLAAEQVGSFEKRIAAVVGAFEAPPSANVPRELYEVVKALDALEFVNRATLYVPDPKESAAMWGFTAWRDSYSNCDGFARFYLAKDFEKAMRKATDGKPADLERLNARHEFVWYRVLSVETGRPLAVVRIDGDAHHSFREYRLGE